MVLSKIHKHSYKLVKPDNREPQQGVINCVGKVCRNQIVSFDISKLVEVYVRTENLDDNFRAHPKVEPCVEDGVKLGINFIANPPLQPYLVPGNNRDDPKQLACKSKHHQLLKNSLRHLLFRPHVIFEMQHKNKNLQDTKKATSLVDDFESLKQVVTQPCVVNSVKFEATFHTCVERIIIFKV